MNALIKQLAEQARCEATENEQHWKSGPSWDLLFETKFAHLLVKKCAQFVEDNFDFVGGEILVKEKILEHFGVDQ